MGYTLPELMTAVSIVGILAAIGTPSFSGLIASQRAKAAASELFATLSRTRSEAIMRNMSVTMSPKSGGWQSGWQIVDPTNAANVLDDHGSTSSTTINGPTSVTYRASGRVQAAAAPSFVITASGGSSTAYQCVSIDVGGRPSMVEASSC
ncbi:GspH/FimT family pseudopilin [Ralstonia sp. SET104]|uniref:GspH/FimT family pseudopilin n=1 Tax=Ralstonia sp. SET104 TaxID=2448774 RepID=UPI001626762D|nr:GspH/FimT family pseudopilin [Ralstonia sp. SET104]